MNELEVFDSRFESIVGSFDRIALKMFRDYKLVVNENKYRFTDIEFYYFSKDVFEDIYVHKHPFQLQQGKWYFHSSGVDITIGNGDSYGGILIRGIGKVSLKGIRERYFIEKEIHGSLNVVTEITSNFNNAFEDKKNEFLVYDVGGELMGAIMPLPTYIVKTKRIGLNPDKDNTEGKKFFNGKFRYVAFPFLKVKDKTQVALDMREQYPDMSNEQINNALGSKFF